MSIKFEHRSFPDPLAPDSIKSSEEYILKWGEAISYEWFAKSSLGDQCRFLSQKDNYHRLRLYSRGEQPTDHYKKMITGEEGDSSSSYTNYDWRPIQVAPKFVKLIVNQMSERLYDVKAEATDKYSTDLRDQYQQNMENLMASKSMIKDSKELLGVDMMPTGMEDIPDSQEEIGLHMKLKYKPNNRGYRHTLNHLN